VSGNSGSGKTAAISRAFGDSCGRDADSDGNETDTVQRITELGFADLFTGLGENNKTPAQLCSTPRRQLSSSEAYLVGLAAELGTGAVVDEFLTALPHAMRATAAAAVGRFCRERGYEGVVLASCHGVEIAAALQPCAHFSAELGVEVPVPPAPPPVNAAPDGEGILREDTAETVGLLLKQPSLVVTRRQIEAGSKDSGKLKRAWWEQEFERHHYLGGEAFNLAADCYLFFVGDHPVAFDSTLPQPGKMSSCRREHRLVVKPDLQGMGMGSAVSCYTASREIMTRRIGLEKNLKDQNHDQNRDDGGGGGGGGSSHRFISKTRHRQLGRSRDASLLWRATSTNGTLTLVDDRKRNIGVGLADSKSGQKAAPVDKRGRNNASGGRKAIQYSHEYVGTDEEREMFKNNCTDAAAVAASDTQCGQFLSNRKMAAQKAASGQGVKRPGKQMGINQMFSAAHKK